MTIVDANGNGSSVSLPGPATMAPVGRHMIPLNGHVITPPRTRWWSDPDRRRRVSMWLLATGVAAIAATVSYSHIYDLGLTYGGSVLASRLLPFSVDMLILVGELMLLHEADGKGHRFPLAWVLVCSGIAATLAANVTYGYQHGGIPGALLWGWPAYSFILVAAGMVAVVKRARVPVADIRPDVADIPVTDMDKAMSALRAGQDTGKTITQFAADIGVGPKTVQRAKTKIKREGNGHA